MIIVSYCNFDVLLLLLLLLVNLDSLPVVADWVPYASFIRWAFQALIINEFKGKTFTCSGGSTSQCLQSGSEVIQSLAFDKQDIRRSVLGLGCCLVIFLLSAVLFLELNRLTFLPLGHTGFKFRGVSPQGEQQPSSGIAMQNIVSVGKKNVAYEEKD